MIILSWIAVLWTFYYRFTEGMTSSQIIHENIRIFLTTAFFALILKGFSPIFNLIIKILVFVRDLFLKVFFPKRWLENIQKQKDKVAYLLEIEILKKDKQIQELTDQVNQKNKIVEETQKRIARREAKRTRKIQNKNRRNEEVEEHD